MQIPTSKLTTKKVRSNAFALADIIPFLGLIVVFLFFSIMTKGKIFTGQNAGILLNEVFSVGLGAAGILFLRAQGNLDLSIGANVCFAAALAAIVSDVSTILIFPVCILAATMVGVLNGLLYDKFRIPDFVVTISMSFILRGLAVVILNGTKGIPFSMNRFDDIGLKFIVFVAILVAVYIIFEYTAYGKHCRTIGASPEVARQSGVNLSKTRVLSFAIAGIICGLVAFFSLVRANTASSSTGAGFEFNVLIAAMIGGMPLSGGWMVKFRAVLIGSLIMALISNGMFFWGVSGIIQQLTRGIIFLGAVAISFDRKKMDTIS